MIWLLLIVFIPGGLNQDILTDVPYRIIHPCDDTSIVIQSPVQRHLDQYNLLIPIPIWCDDLILTFDSEATLEFVNPAMNIYIIKDLYDTQGFHLKFVNSTEQILNSTIFVSHKSSAIPYVQSIRLNHYYQLCNHPKSGYFHDFKTEKRAAVRDIAPSAMTSSIASKQNSGDPHKRSIRQIAFEHSFTPSFSTFRSSVSNGNTADFLTPSFSTFRSSVSNRNTGDFLTPSFSTFRSSVSNGNTADFLTPSFSTLRSSVSNRNTGDFLTPSFSTFRSSVSNGNTDDFLTPSFSTFRSSVSNRNTGDFLTPSFSTFRSSVSNGNTDDFLTPSISTFKSSVSQPFSTCGNCDSSGNTDGHFKSLLSTYKSSASNGNTDDFFTPSFSTFRSSVSNENTNDHFKSLLSRFQNSSSYRDTDDFFKRPFSTFGNTASREKADVPNIVSSRFSISPDESCGLQKVVHTPLIVNGQSSYSGQWPWHVALFRVAQQSLKYICGGTLLSKTLVLTAGHCATIRGSANTPESLRVHLGRFDLYGGDPTTQEREVFQVIIHPKFSGTTLDDDIALLKLKSEAVFTDYVQPACLWAANMLPGNEHFGTVVGWGFSDKDILSSTLQKAVIPIIPELICLKSNPTFFHQKLNSNKFCAGYGNGTSACNGDSGGGLMLFVPYRSGNSNVKSGAWHVRGIVSLSVGRKDKPICDPYEYTVFTDVEKYRDWILQYMK